MHLGGRHMHAYSHHGQKQIQETRCALAKGHLVYFICINQCMYIHTYVLLMYACMYIYLLLYCCITAYDIDSVNGLTVLRETLEQLPKPNYNLLKYIRYITHFDYMYIV